MTYFAAAEVMEENSFFITLTPGGVLYRQPRHEEDGSACIDVDGAEEVWLENAESLKTISNFFKPATGTSMFDHVTILPGPNVIKLFTVVIYKFS